MNDIESLRDEVHQLRRRVEVLEGASVKRVERQPITPTASGTQQPTTTHTSARFGILRVIAGIIGATWLLGGLAGGSFPLIVIGGILALLVVVWPWKQTVTTPSGSSVTHTATTTITTPHTRQPSALEKEFATHWLSWIGMISVVVGVGFLLQFVFRSMGPWGNVVTGLAVGVILFFLSALARRSTPAFSFLLQSGGWATIFISTLSLRVIENGTLLPTAITTTAILTVIASMITAAMFQHSRVLTAGGFLLGYVGLWSAPLDTMTFAMFALLALGMTLVATAQRWPQLVVVGNLIAYIVTVQWMDYTGSRLSDQLSAAMILLIVQALAFGAAHWMIKAQQKIDEQYIALGSIINLAGLFLALNFLFQITKTATRWEVAGMLALVCTFLAIMTRVVQSRRMLETPYWIFASAFLAYASFQALHGTTYLLVLVFEATVITVGGILGKLRGLRWSGYALFFMLTLNLLPRLLGNNTISQPYISSHFTVSLLAILTMLGVAFLERLRGTGKYAASIIADSGIGLALLLAANAWPDAWAVSVWGIIAVLATTYGHLRNSRNARYAAVLISVMAGLYWLASVASTDNLAGSLPMTARLVSGIVLVLTMGFLAALNAMNTARPKAEAQWPTILWWKAVTFLTIVLAVEVAGTWLSVAWGITGIVLLAIGLMGQIRTARRQGLSLVLLTLLKLYVIDITTLGMSARIISFILLGVLILGISYWYNRLHTSHDHPTTTS